MWQLLVALAEVGIFLGGTVIALFIAPNLDSRHWTTRLAAVGIFLAGGTAFLELGFHTAFDADGFTPDELTTWHMSSVILLLLLSVWTFIIGLYQEAPTGRQPMEGHGEKTQDHAEAEV